MGCVDVPVPAGNGATVGEAGGKVGWQRLCLCSLCPFCSGRIVEYVLCVLGGQCGVMGLAKLMMMACFDLHSTVIFIVDVSICSNVPKEDDGCDVHRVNLVTSAAHCADKDATAKDAKVVEALLSSREALERRHILQQGPMR